MSPSNLLYVVVCACCMCVQIECVPIDFLGYPPKRWLRIHRSKKQLTPERLPDHSKFYAAKSALNTSIPHTVASKFMRRNPTTFAHKPDF